MPGTGFVLNSRTGMIGMPIQTIDGIQVTCLLNPKIVPGSRIQIDQASVQQAKFDPSYTGVVNNSMIPATADDGFYKVLMVNHTGDTRGTPWYTNCLCLRADGKGPIPLNLVQKGINVDV